MIVIVSTPAVLTIELSLLISTSLLMRCPRRLKWIGSLVAIRYSVASGNRLLRLFRRLCQTHKARALLHPLQSLKVAKLAKSAQAFVADQIGALIAGRERPLLDSCVGGVGRG